jgi:tetratricopeptide (TPR) repeat protein
VIAPGIGADSRALLDARTIIGGIVKIGLIGPSAASRTLLILLCVGVATAWMAWLCRRDPVTNFLPGDSRAQWIAFPAAFDSRSHRVANFDTVFKRRFVLEHAPDAANINVRAAKRLELRLNGVALELSPAPNWKQVTNVDVHRFVRAGENVVEARVFNDNAPPLLWLVLNAGDTTIRSSHEWEASCAGSAWRAAALADAPRFPGPGNAIAGGEDTFASLKRIWPVWLGFAAIAAAVLSASAFWFRRRILPNQTTLVAIAVVALAWAGLCWNNARLLPHPVGFDAKGHLNYIKFVQERHSLPAPTEGFEMYHQPLYYVVSAAILSLCRTVTGDETGIVVLRTISILIGFAHALFVFLSLRLLLPHKLVPQLVGFALAAFLPMQLYMAHYVTNETLAALLISAAVYLALRIVTDNNAGRGAFIALAVVLGAALLTKITAVIVIPFIVAALTWKLWNRGASTIEMAQKIGPIIAISLLFAGWHYYRISKQPAMPLLGGPASGDPFWQDDGYRILGYFTRFGHSLVRPLFSATASFADGLYATLWGDGLCGGVATISARPPWNYDLMAAGYLLSLYPALLVMVGAVGAAVNWWRRGDAKLFILLGLSAGMAFGLVYRNLLAPLYGSVKSFYGLSALVALAYFGASGWQALSRSHKYAPWALNFFLLVWVLNSFASFWIRPTATYHVYNAFRLAQDQKMQAGEAEAAEAVRLDPSNSAARQALAGLRDELGRPRSALEEAEQAVALRPADCAAHFQLAMVLEHEGENDRAMAECRRAIELGPESVPAYEFLLSLILNRQNFDTSDAIEVGSAGLAVAPFNAELHYDLGLAMAEKGELVAAANQFAYALLPRPKSKEARARLRQAVMGMAESTDGPALLAQAAAQAPDSAEMYNALAWIFATHPDASRRNGKEAVRLAERACDITASAKSAAALSTLATAYAETGRFADAIRAAEEALSLARSSRDATGAALAETLLAAFRANEPYRDNGASRF